MKRQGFSESNAHGSPCDPFHQSSLIDFQAWQSWQWDGQSVESIRDQRVMLNKWPNKVSEWVNTVPDDTYSVMPVKDACAFIQKCRKQFNGGGNHEA